MPHATQLPRRDEAKPRARRRQAGGNNQRAEPHAARLKKSDGEVKDFLQTGMTPDGDVAAESMAEVVQNNHGQALARTSTP